MGKVICDIICHECKIIKQDVWLAYGEKPEEVCPECKKPMKKKVSFGSFELKYNNKTDMCDWTGATSQYWRAFNEAKGRGENVKPGDED